MTVEPVKTSWKSYIRAPSAKLNGVQACIHPNASMVSSHLMSEESGSKIYVCKYQVVPRLAEMHCFTHDEETLRVCKVQGVCVKHVRCKKCTCSAGSAD